MADAKSRYEIVNELVTRRLSLIDELNNVNKEGVNMETNIQILTKKQEEKEPTYAPDA